MTRTVPVSPHVLDVVRPYIGKHPERWTNQWCAVFRRAGWPVVPVSVLQLAWGARAIKRGLPFKAIALALGHRPMDSTHRRVDRNLHVGPHREQLLAFNSA